jgi:multidrug efflux pump subunit AcrB
MKTIKDLVEYFVKYPILANIVIAITLLGGIVSLVNTKKSFFPTRSDTRINITVVYPGASPEEMEEGVTLKIEESIIAVAGIKEFTSTSSENSAAISVEIIETYDIDEIYTEIKNAVDAINSFPAGAEKPIIAKQRQRTMTQFLALTGNVDLKTLKTYAEQVEDDLMATGQISQVNISGFPPLEISIEVSEETLRRYNLTFDQVAASVRSNNQDISAGSVKSPNEEILIRSRAKETDAEQIGEIIVRSNTDGSHLLLRDIATITEQFEDSPNMGFLNGERAVTIQVNKLETEDLQEISETVHAYIADFNRDAEGVKLSVNFDFLEMLTERLDMLTSNGVIGLLLVIVTLGLFLSLRVSFWVAWGIPSSFLGMFIIGSFVGLTINMISLFGMIVVIGILVDDGIVIAENIYSHFEKHGNPIKAAVQGTMEVLPAVFTSVTTTIVAFMPLLILTGGFEFMKDMAFVVVASLAFSLLEAFFVLPAHLASKKVLSVKKEDTRSYKIRKVLNGIIDWMRYKLYAKMLRFTMQYRAVSVAMVTAFVLVVGGMFAGGLIKFTFFPQVAWNSFNVGIEFKPGERETKVLGYIERFDSLVWEVNNDLMKEHGTEESFITNTFSFIGSSGMGENGSHTGFVQVFYEELDQYGLNQFDLVRLINQKIGPVPEAEKFMVGSTNSRWGKPVSIRLIGKNYEELEGAKEFLKDELAKFAELKEIQDNVPVGRREMQFDLRPEAYFLGLTHNSITAQMRQGFFGEEVQRFMKGNDELKVWVRYPKDDRASISQLEDLKIKTSNGEIPLTQLADYEIERGVTGISHYNASRAVTIEADMVDPFGEVPPIVQNIQSNVLPVLKSKFPSVETDMGGQSQRSAEASGEFVLFFGGVFIIILFLIMTTFRSFYQAILVMGMIPLGFFGAALGHGIEDWMNVDKQISVSLMSIWGMVALSGVIINDAVVFLSKFNSLVKNDGLSVYDAAFEAGLARFRPIMLTSLTTVIGLYPLIKETSFQAQFIVPMAISMAYGVLIGTFIILLFFPVFILIFNDFRRWAKWLWTGQKPSREEVERVLIDEKRLEEYRESA